jgi:hypothetical protein
MGRRTRKKNQIDPYKPRREEKEKEKKKTIRTPPNVFQNR